MTGDLPNAGLMAIHDVLARMQDQLGEIARSNNRIEAVQSKILDRLDTIAAGQAIIGQVAASAHAAALGIGGPLPSDVLSDPLLERYLLAQPADPQSRVRAIVEWRKAASVADSVELADLLARQYRPSPTDTPEVRLLRYQLAAISREELRGRGVVPPPPPASTFARDQSPEAIRQRSADLARLWRNGESTALFAEPELAGVVDLFEAVERQGSHHSEERLAADLAELHRALSERLEAGERPTAAEARDVSQAQLTPTLDPERPR